MGKVLFALALMAAIWWLLNRAKRPRISLSEDEARAVLGVDARADAEAIRAAHRRLVSAVHPDKGGSADLTRRINAARDVLLRAR
ncbi:molecular chaperone DnaJ [Sphingomonas spermidinifaciens]|uniref:Molecular chaperone DnaJ n=1 Tax=Sphingomonas spermidinifaciens TaxID=1141889 RepID=A0A2A4AZY5_9SPHN|nr:DnaJ domain-containing protein [Sphingomonas spermidinifaciens]PCD02503.1 molecular chaperone DnaJ [Sphingomonas spermidinifaciens]